MLAEEHDAAWLSRMLVSSCLQDLRLLPDLLRQVNASDLDPPYAQTLTVLARDYGPGAAVDHARLQHSVAAASPGLPTDFVFTLSMDAMPVNWGWYLDKFMVIMTRRKLALIVDLAGPASRMDDLDAGIERVKRAVSDAEAVRTPMRIPNLHTGLLWNWEPEPDAVLIPGLLWRQARVIITGFEGDGKSIMLRQLAIAGAAGLHPFSTLPMAPIRTLYVDLENPDALARLSMKTMLHTLSGRHLIEKGDPLDDRCAFQVRSEGLDVVGRVSDRNWLESVVAAQRPDLLCIGPIYRLAAGGGDLDEATASKVMNYLNMLRVRYDMAIVTEAHAPHGMQGGKDHNANRSMRPSGSSAWMRFPEIGRGLRRDVKLSDALKRGVFHMEKWRNDRSIHMKFPEYVARATQGQVWFDDVTEQVEAQMGR